MIQRIPSLLLFAAAFLNLSVLFLPLWVITNPDLHTETILTGVHITTQGAIFQHIGPGENFILLLHSLMIAFASAFGMLTVFQHKQAEKQIKWTYLSRSFYCAQLVVSMFIISKPMPAYAKMDVDFPGEAGFGLFFPIGAVLLVWIAATQIKKEISEGKN